GQVIDLTGVQIGYTDGSGLGGGGDAVNLWIGNPSSSQPIALGTYPDTDANDGQTYDLELGEFSAVGNMNGAVATIAGGGDNGDVPNIGSPGNGNAVTQIFLDFSESYVSVQEDEGQISVEVSLNEAASEDITFDVELLDGGSAENGNEFNFSTQNLSIAAGQTSTTFTVDITDNSNDTEDVFFVLQLTNILNAEMGSTNYHAIYILDDDNQAPTASENILDISLLTSHLVDENGTAEITAFDEDTQRLFVVNNTHIEIVDFSDPANLVNSTNIDVTPYGASAQSVAIKNGLVAIAVANSVETDNGFVLFTDTDGNNPQTVEVGALPDMLTFTPDGTKLLVANEGQPNADYSIDPEGSVSVIDVTGGLDNITQTEVQNLDFNAFDSELATLLANDVRIFGPNATVSQDLEPEYIVVSENSERAYVSLQENNAYAVVDLVNSVVESIIPYGLKDHSLTENSLDVNDNIDFIFDATWPIKGMYMPDGIATYMVDGTTYIVTANEGDAREYDTYEEEVNLGDAGYELDPSVFTNAEILAMESNLAAINISNASGDSNDDGLFEEIHVYGGRSFSIYEAESGVQVYDSGNDFERIIAADPVYSEIFNASNSNNNYKNRSDNKGVEPEGVIVQEINDAMYAFVILERVGGVMVYDVTNPNAPQFIDYKNNRDATEGGEESGDLGPEGILYIPADQNALDIGLLVISNEVSATVSVYAINNDTLGVKSFNPDNNEFTFYPNPVKSTLHLSASSDYSVYNLNGQLVKSVKDSSNVQVEDLQAGIYILKSASGESYKFVKL
ncbi:choice-of-anchor I family protein, partial [Psychroflexus aestuariivivens]|uniref:choice-of-anchor I family protein n=1 Tax=Psychroflexus aestuariivivens TaxID=1795040 RepID=UPI000FD89821